MKTLSSVSCGIKALEDVLNRIVAALNQRTPVAGAGITINESGSGAVIALANKDDDQGQPQNQGGGGGGVIQASGPYTIMLNGVVWKNVTIVDPVSCAQSTLTVLAQGSGSITFNATLSPLTQ